jgi:hypothetical protein
MKKYLIPFIAAVLAVTVASGCPNPPQPTPNPIALVVTRTDSIPDGTFITMGQDNAHLLGFSIACTSTEARLASMSVSGGAAGEAVALNAIERLKLYDDTGTLVSSIVPFSASSTSFDVQYVIPIGTHKGFSLAADFKSTSATGTFKIKLTSVKALDNNNVILQSLNGANMLPLSPTNPIPSAQFIVTP